MQLFGTRLVRAGLTVERDSHWERAPVLSSPGKLRQLFANLIGNPMDAMRLGGGLGIRISEYQRFDPPGQMV